MQLLPGEGKRRQSECNEHHGDRRKEQRRIYKGMIWETVVKKTNKQGNLRYILEIANAKKEA